MSADTSYQAIQENEVTTQSSGSSKCNHAWLEEAKRRYQGKLERVLDAMVYPEMDTEIVTEMLQPDSQARALMHGLDVIADVLDREDSHQPDGEFDLNYPPLELIKPPRSLLSEKNRD